MKFGKKHSSAVEIMNRMIELIRRNFPNIKFIKFEDDSQLECSANPLDKLDLLYYSVATSGKSWYEKHFNAYYVPREKFIEYKCKVRDFVSKQTKSETSFDTIENLIRDNGTITAHNMIKNRKDEFTHLYNSSNTFLEFFEKINKVIEKEDKCYFYKEWIRHFVIKHIGEIERKWVIDVYKFNPSQYGGKFTRKRKHK